MTSTSYLTDELKNYLVKKEITNFDVILSERKELLQTLATFIVEKEDDIKLTFICTHNSRRSHMSQLWAAVAAHYYNINATACYSGGTEATAFNPRAVKAMKDAGFIITTTDTGSNPVYDVKFAVGTDPIKAFSKTYDDPFNPQEGYIAVMTCDHANEACPIVHGSDKKISVLYKDPKEADDTPGEEVRYAERCAQIANELFFVFSEVKRLKNDKG